MDLGAGFTIGFTIVGVYDNNEFLKNIAIMYLFLEAFFRVRSEGRRRHIAGKIKSCNSIQHENDASRVNLVESGIKRQQVQVWILTESCQKVKIQAARFSPTFSAKPFSLTFGTKPLWRHTSF